VTVPAKPATPRHAASLVLIRQGSEGPEVLMGRRPRKSSFAPDVFVFPGGGLEAGDRLVRPARPLSDACIRLTAASRSLAHALAAAALRETHEETGMVLPLLSEGGSSGPDFSHLTLIARAITPTNSPIRFHARFFQADAALAQGEPEATPELADLAFRPLAQSLVLPMFDITEAVLRHVQTPVPDEPAFLFTYRNGGPKRTGLR
jgi:8-oxo-dGTP pyrophosphatase MutT (NUDIX family)